MSSRIAVFGQFVATVGENIAYGTTSGKDIVLQLIIDDGVASRGHRTNIFNADYTFVGSWASGHVTYSSMTVIDYAGGMTANAHGTSSIVPTIDCETASSATAGSTTPAAPTAPAVQIPTPAYPIPEPAAPAPPPPPLVCDATSLAAAVTTITAVVPAVKTTVVRKIRFANTDCVFNKVTSTTSQLECILADAPTCGEWLPEIYSAHGLIPVDSTAAKIKVDCTVTTITPNTDLNVLGGDSLTISGTNFPKFVADNTVDIGFSNSQTTKCVLISSKSTEMVCMTKSFDKVANLDQDFTMTININSQVIAQTLSIKMKAINKDATQIVPSSASPVLKTKI